jgi:hypothetical protein
LQCALTAFPKSRFIISSAARPTSLLSVMEHLQRNRLSVPQRTNTMTTLIIGSLYRDIVKKRSLVTITWEDDPEKRLGLVVPYDCTLENLKAETEKAVRALAKELESATIRNT